MAKWHSKKTKTFFEVSNSSQRKFVLDVISVTDETDFDRLYQQMNLLSFLMLFDFALSQEKARQCRDLGSSCDASNRSGPVLAPIDAVNCESPSSKLYKRKIYVDVIFAIMRLARWRLSLNSVYRNDLKYLSTADFL